MSHSEIVCVITVHDVEVALLLVAILIVEYKLKLCKATWVATALRWACNIFFICYVILGTLAWLGVL